jgi:hypothetical protein
MCMFSLFFLIKLFEFFFKLLHDFFQYKFEGISSRIWSKSPSNGLAIFLCLIIVIETSSKSLELWIELWMLIRSTRHCPPLWSISSYSLLVFYILYSFLSKSFILSILSLWSFKIDFKRKSYLYSSCYFGPLLYVSIHDLQLFSEFDFSFYSDYKFVIILLIKIFWFTSEAKTLIFVLVSD